jgi:hypothetical protein
MKLKSNWPQKVEPFCGRRRSGSPNARDFA